MILLGILSQYTWVDFLKGLLVLYAIIMGIGFVLNRFVWLRKAGLTKNGQRNLRESFDKGDADRDYSEVKSVDDSFDDEDIVSDEDYNPSTSRITEQIDDGDFEFEAQPLAGEDDENPTESVTQEQIDGNNAVSQTVFLQEQEDCEILADEDFDSDVRRNTEILEDEDSEENYASLHSDEELSDIEVKQGSCDMEGDETDIKIDEDDTFDLMNALPKDIDESYPVAGENTDDPEDEGPVFEE